MSEMHRKVYNKMTLHAMAAQVLYLLGGTSIDCGVQVNKFLNENMPAAVIDEHLLSAIMPCDGFPAAAVRFCVWDYDEADVWTKKDELVLLTKRAVGFGYDEYFDLLYPTSPLN